jgi:prevent-host-death family protein
MLEVKIEKILPVTEARDSFNKLVDEVEGTDELYVLTKNGKPAAVLVGVHHLEKLTGTSEEELMAQANVAEQKDEPTAMNTAETPMADTSTTSPAINIGPSTTDAPVTPATDEPVLGEAPTTEATPATTEPMSSPAAANQQSGATASPFENAAPATAAETTGPVEDPLDFLNDSDTDPIPTTPGTPATANPAPTPLGTAPTMPEATPAFGQTPVANEPTPAPTTPTTTTPTTDPTIPTPPAQQM